MIRSHSKKYLNIDMFENSNSSNSDIKGNYYAKKKVKFYLIHS